VLEDDADNSPVLPHAPAPADDQPAPRSLPGEMIMQERVTAKDRSMGGGMWLQGRVTENMFVMVEMTRMSVEDSAVI
jgi:hypothetical protein